MKFTNKTYDILKWFAMCVLPAFSVLYCTMAAIWGFGYTEQVVGTVTAINTFLGVTLGISSNNYKIDSNK